MSYTDDEVTEAHSRAVRLAELTDVATPWKELIWAASKYLEAKAVIEWYGDEATHDPNAVLDRKCAESGSGYRPDVYLIPEIQNDKGAKAREYLEKLNQNKGDK